MEMSVSSYALIECTGNEKLHLLTSARRQRLVVEMANFNEQNKYAEYDNFKVSSERLQYKLVSLGRYTGTAGQCRIK